MLRSTPDTSLKNKMLALIKALKGKIEEITEGATNAVTRITRKSRKPRGRRTRIPDDADEATRRSLQRENDSADILADRGYDVEQNPSVDGPMNPDYRIDGEIYDNYAPSTGNPQNIASEVSKKIERGQTERVILNLSDSPVDINKLRQQFSDWPIEGLKDLKIITADGRLGTL